MGTQGRLLSEAQVQKIIDLLGSTDTAMGDIAERMGCTRSTIVQINRRHGVRDYDGKPQHLDGSSPGSGKELKK